MKRATLHKISTALFAGILTLSSFSVLAQKYELVSLIEVTAPSCTGDGDGSIFVSPHGGTEPYTYLWSTGDTTATIQNLSAGTYTVTIEDSEGGMMVSDINLFQPDPVQITGVKVNASSSSALDGSIDVTITGGDNNYLFLWDTSNGLGLIPNQMDQVNISNGYYTLNVEDGNGCRASLDFELGGINLINNPATGVSGMMLSGGSTTFGSVYPNPSNGAVVLRSAKDINRIDVYSSMGNLVKTVSSMDENNMEEQLQLTSGNYTVVFMYSDGTIENEKLVVR